MKKSTLILIIAGLIAFLWFKSRKDKSVSSKEVSATYIGEYIEFAQDQYVTAGDWVSGLLNDDGSLTMEFYDETGTHTITFPADKITDIQVI